MTTEELLTTKEVAEILKVKIGTLEHWRMQGEGPKWIKLGETKRSAIRYRRSDLNAYLNGAVPA